MHFKERGRSNQQESSRYEATSKRDDVFRLHIVMVTNEAPARS